MQITGIICEYNPFHLGHQKQLDIIRANDPEGGIVCLMSGNFVQRGKPAIVDKMLRAQAAVLSGADLVLELPVTAALSSAEGFASEGVRILSGFCHRLCFGAETGSRSVLMNTAAALLSPAFFAQLKLQLAKGLSFPAARQNALEAMGIDAGVLSHPNDILATEYCKAILAQKSAMEPMVIQRQGDYHDTAPDSANPSATAVRQQMLLGGIWHSFVPKAAHDVFWNATLHTMQAGERAVLAKLRCMTDAEFAQLPYSAEGLWRKLMHACRECATLEELLCQTKSKRYTRTRLDRMVLCAFLGLTKQDLSCSAPYTRVLAFNDKGREILKQARLGGEFPNIGQRMDHPYQAIEDRCGDLYGLFAQDDPEPPRAESKYRVYYKKQGAV